MELSNSTVWTPEPEIKAHAPTRIQLPPNHSPFTNGMLKRHAPPVVTYRECLKNHAVALGGHAVDGCGEFMLSPASNPADPTSIRCAACDCHRSFHRRHHPQPPDGATISDVSHDGGVNNNTPLSSSGGQKRFRTKFTHSQMEKMLELAERVGWRMQRKDEELLNIFL